MTIDDHFYQFESLARRLVEGAFDRPFGQRRLVHEAARLVAVDIERTALTGKQAHAYIVELHPDSLTTLINRSPDLEQFLADYLHDIALEYNLSPPERPGIQLVPNHALAQDKVNVVVREKNSVREATMKAPAIKSGSKTSGPVGSHAFLILNGRKHIKLTKPLITLGRHLDCDIILDDPSTSRQHSQLRWRSRHFIILDLGSKAGTLVNNRPITRHVLQSGDVIRLGNTTFVYGEESAEETSSPGSDDSNSGETRQLPRTGIE
jgi:hypothetical protein